MESDLGRRLALLRAARGLTQSDLAKMLGVTPTAVSHWERGRSQVPSGEVPRLAQALGVTISELYGDETYPAQIRFDVVGGRPELRGISDAEENTPWAATVAFLWKRMAQLGLTEHDLAARVGLSSPILTRLLTGEIVPNLALQRRIAEALDVSLGQLILGGKPYRPLESTHTSLTADHEESHRRQLPIYQYAAAGDPSDPDDAPIPVRREAPPPDRASVIGPEGFGVEVRGTSMTKRGIHDGDVVWVNPGLRPRQDKPVVAYVQDCLDANGIREDGVVVKVYARREEGDYGLLSDGDQGRYWLDCREVLRVWPVVAVSRWWTPE